MTETSPRLQLPYILAAQAQKHVTHNEAIRTLDALVQLSVSDRHLAAPPTTPGEGARYIVAAAATGAWAGQTGKVAAFQDGAWAFLAPQTGWLAWVADENQLVVWTGSAWTAATSGSLNPAPLVGVNATADATNKLSVASAAVLFNHIGAGHQVKINKAAAAATASLLFQTGFAGRAEMGTTGDDDFHFKVSPDGTAWHEAILIDKDTGGVSFPNSSIGGAVAVEDEGTQILAAASRLNFTGAGVTVSDAGSGEVTVTVPGSGGTGNVPSGGASGQILAKASAADFNTVWVNPPSGGGAITIAPAYANPGGTGDRQSLITVTASSGLVNTATYPLVNFVDGATANTSADSIAFLANTPVAGHWIQFDFLFGASKVITEATWKQSGTQSHGVWQWQGSNDASTWTAVGAAFTLGGATSQVQTSLAANTTGYRFYRLLGFSGNASGGPFVQEIEFKIGATVIDGLLEAPDGGIVRQVLTKASNANGHFTWSDPGLIYRQHTDGMLAEWYFNEGSGEQTADYRGNYPIDFGPTHQAAYAAPAPKWTKRGLRLESSMIQTPSIPGARTVALLYRVARGDASGFIISGGAGSGAGTTVQSAATAEPHHIGGGNGIAPLARRAADGTAAFRLNRGGWVLVFREMTQAYNTVIGFGGRHSTTTSRCTEFEIAWAGVWNDTLNDAERGKIYDSVRRIVAEREVYLDWRDCPEQTDCVLLWGQSNADGRALIADLSATDQARAFNPNVLIQPASSSINGYARPEQLWLGRNQLVTGTGNVATQFGPEMGAAWAHEDADGARVRTLAISKYAIGSSFVAPSTLGAPVTASNSWNPDEVQNSGVFWLALRHWWDLEQGLLAKGIGPRLRALWFMQGEQDATLSAAASIYQAELQDLWNALKLNAGYPSGQGLKAVVARIRDQGPGMTFAADVRAAQAAFATANNIEAALIDTDAFPLAADNTHHTAAGYKSLGQAFYSAVTWS